MTNPIKGSDLDIRIVLTYLGESIQPADGKFPGSIEISCFDSYNCGKVWKYIVPEDKISYVDGGIPYWNVRFDASAQKYVGAHNVRCIVTSLEGLGTQQALFKNAFFLDDFNTLGGFNSAKIAPLIGEIESSVIDAQLPWPSIVKGAEYTNYVDNPVIKITFTNGTTTIVPVNNLFPFRVLSSSEYSQLTELENGVFYYTYNTYTVSTFSSNCDVTGGGSIADGDTCTLTATPNDGFYIQDSSWEGLPSGAVLSEDYTSATFTVTEDVSVTVSCVPIPTQIYVDLEDTSVICNRDSSGDIVHTVKLTNADESTHAFIDSDNPPIGAPIYMFAESYGTVVDTVIAVGDETVTGAALGVLNIYGIAAAPYRWERADVNIPIYSYSTVVNAGDIVYDSPFMDNGHEVTYVSNPTLTLTFSSSDAALGTISAKVNGMAVSSPARILPADLVTFTATTAMGSQFVTFIDILTGMQSNDDPWFTTFDHNAEVLAIFEIDVPPLTLTFSSADASLGTISVRVNGELVSSPAQISTDDLVEFTATPAEGSNFGWFENTHSGYQTYDNPWITTFDRDADVFAIFEIDVP